MKLKRLVSDRFEILACMDDGSCPTEDFLQTGEETTVALREGLLEMLKVVAANGFASRAVPVAWTHEVNKKNKIFEFIKGPLRLFYFKGNGNQIVICTSGTRKSGRKADKGLVAQAVGFKKQYEQAVQSRSLIVEEDDEN